VSFAGRVREWFARDGAAPGRDDARWVVLDTETTGLDPQRDRLLAVGAVGVDAQGIRLGDSFEAVLQTPGVGAAANVAVHGIGHDAQRAGVPAAAALAAFAAYVGEAPCVGFHVEFDRAVLARAFAEVALEALPARWLDLEPLAGMLAPYTGGVEAQSLDDWLGVFGIDVAERHNAAGDALATAELLLRLRVLAAAQGVHGVDALARMARQRRWLGGGR
jgi:DNA polymerase III subunit epsilon